MPIILRFNNYTEFLIQSLKIVRNMQNSIETRGNLCIKLGPPVVRAQLLKLSTVLYKLIYWTTRRAPGCQQSTLKCYTSSGPEAYVKTFARKVRVRVFPRPPDRRLFSLHLMWKFAS